MSCVAARRWGSKAEPRWLSIRSTPGLSSASSGHGRDAFPSIAERRFTDADLWDPRLDPPSCPPVQRDHRVVLSAAVALGL